MLPLISRVLRVMLQETEEMGEGQPHLEEATAPDPATAPEDNAATTHDPAAEEGSAESMMIIPGFSEVRPPSKVPWKLLKLLNTY